jgi:uncharacterized protein
MKQLPQEVVQAWSEREGPVVFTTVNSESIPNAIYASMVNRMSDGRIAVADNYFDKTISNIQEGSRASILFITRNHKSYQIKGTIEYHREGPLFEEMLTWADPKHPRKGVAIIIPEELFQGGTRLA